MASMNATPQVTEASVDAATPESNLTPAQQLLWAGQRLAPESPLYNMVFLFTISGELDPRHFQAAFQALVERSDAFRLVIDDADGIPRQRVLSQVDVAVERLDFREAETPEAAVREWAEERCQRRFDLSKPLFDTALIQASDRTWIWYLNQHHLITDIAALQLVYETVGKLYEQSVAGTLEQAPELPSYTELAIPTPSKRVTDYWQKQTFSGTELYQRSAIQVSPQTHRVSCELGTERTAALKQLANQSFAQALTPQLSLFNVVAGILLAYLHRVSQSSTVAFATPAHCRPTVLQKETIGVFIELFPLQTEIVPEETFASVIQKVSEASGMMLRRAQPGASALVPAKDVNVVLNFIHAQVGDFAGCPVKTEWIHAGAGDPRHHLRLQVHDFDNRGSLQLHFDFNRDLFAPALQERAMEHFLALVDAVLAEPESAIATVNLLNESESSQLMALGQPQPAQSNLAESDLDTASDILPKTVVQLFETQVARIPEAIALRCETTTLTYQQLNHRANQLAHYLHQQGVTAETPVGIYLHRSPEMLVVLWGILKAGGAYVPLDPSHPPERITHILIDTQAKWVITQAELASHLGPSVEPLLLGQLDLAGQSSENLSTTHPTPTPQLNQLAYLLYTSGSTGQPKGVEIEHRNLTNYVQWAQQQYVRGRTLAFPLFSPLTFDLTVTSIYVPLTSGGEVVIYPEGDGAIDLSLQRLFADDAVDIIKLTPSHLSLVQGMTIGSRVKTLILGGEDLKTSLAGAIAAASDHPLEIYNEYGPTEATVGCMIHRFESAAEGEAAPPSVSIGKPAANSNIYLLDEQLNLVPRGSVGEIFIGGPGLARGYLNRPELTAERFVQSSLLTQNQRLYRTGDLGRWEENGVLTYLGRGDRQVKIHGTRIELGEIEAALANHSDVTATAVTLVQPTPPLVHNDPVTYCTSCGIASNYPGITFDDQGVCDICRTYETYRHRTEQYFESMDVLRSQLDAARQRKRGKYDCMMLLSGGKDSTYALAQLVSMGYQVFAFTLDNGYISQEAKANIRRVVETLGVDHTFGTTPAMNEIFVDSLNRHCNVCNGCFKTIYTLSMKLAHEQGIPCIVTGLSRGQFFETRLTEEWFTQLFGQEQFDVKRIDATILDARKAYHRADDAVSRLMDVDVFKNDEIFNEVQIVDFYRYCDVELAEMLTFLREQVPWIRPSDTGRSTNCLINNVGIHLHTKQRGYHNYALPYSWDVRMGHKTSEAAIDELNDEIDVGEVDRILKEIGYDETQVNQAQLAAYYVATGGSDISTTELRAFLAQRLPRNLVPAYFIPLAEMPLTGNGKVDFAQLPDAQASRPELKATFVAPQTSIETMMAQFWQEVLKINRIGIHDNFFDLGGDSIMAIQIAARMSDSGFVLSPNQLFQHPTLAQLAREVAPEVEQSAEPVTGIVPLTPIQQAFLEQRPPEPEQFTQTVVVDVAESLVPERLEAAIAHLINQHDTLRLSYCNTERGWEQRYQDTAPAVQLTQMDLSGQSEAEQATAIATTKAQLQTQLNLEKGDLVRAALFKVGEGDRLIIVIHHLAVDAVSWLTLLKDLETVYQQLSQGQQPLLPLKTSSFQAWAKGLEQVAVSQEEQDYWLKPTPRSLALLKSVASATQSFEHGQSGKPDAIAPTISCQLSPELTQTLLQRSDRPQEILLTALTLAVQQQTNQSAVNIDLEGHGREETRVPGIRLVRTVGWFTSLFPVTLQLDAAEPLRSVKQALRQVPQNGIGYGILKYCRGDRDPQIQRRLKTQPQADILFNYLGQIEQLLPNDSLFSFAEPLQVSRSPEQTLSHPLDISAFIRNGQLQIDCCHSGLNVATVEAIVSEMMQQLESLLTGTTQTQAAAEDFPLANLNRQKMDKLAALLNKADRSKKRRPGVKSSGSKPSGTKPSGTKPSESNGQGGTH